MLEARDIAVRRRGFSLEIATLTVPAARRVTLIGPSGSGKSTLLRTLAGLEASAQVGGLTWCGKEIRATPPQDRPFGWLAQGLGLWPHLTALQHVAFARSRGRSVHSIDSDHDVLKSVHLTHRDTAYPATLSGGEQQRLAFARVMAVRPAFALLDEPFSHLDPVTADDLGRSFKALSESTSMGLLQVSHQVGRPSDEDWFWALEAGRLTQAGTWSDLRNDPATPWIARFVALQA